jgi:hypothetical protein
LDRYQLLVPVLNISLDLQSKFSYNGCMMTKEEELARCIEDRDIAENDAILLGEEMRQFEIAHPDDFEEHDEWNSLHDEINALDSEASYLTACIEDLEDQIAESEKI